MSDAPERQRDSAPAETRYPEIAGSWRIVALSIAEIAVLWVGVALGWNLSLLWGIVAIGGWFSLWLRTSGAHDRLIAEQIAQERERKGDEWAERRLARSSRWRSAGIWAIVIWSSWATLLALAPLIV